MKSSSINRREFLQQSSCGAVGSISMLSTLLNLKLAGQAAAATLVPGTDARALVCVYLGGGNDAFNMLVPRGPEHIEYSVTRGNLALTEDELLPLSLSQAVAGGRQFGIHPAMPEVRELFNGMGGDVSKRRLSFVANIGTLVQPTTLAEYQSGAVRLPKALFSHSDQSDQWMTSIPEGSTEFSGWIGRAADLLHSGYNTGKVSMNISLSGNNLLQTGKQVSQFVITPGGSLTFSGPTSAGDPTHPLYLKNQGLISLVEQKYTNLLQESFAQITRESVQAQRQFQSAFDAFNTAAIAGLFPPGNYLAQSLLAVARVIAIRKSLGLRRQTFFLSYGGWDHHFELLNTQAEMLRQVSQALGAFQKALEILGLAGDVVTFTASEFGRTLRSNGRGTDHAWGSHQLVMGGGIEGGRVFGRYPSLVLDGADDVGYGGRILPTTSVDVFFHEMLRWLGVSPTDMPVILPNIARFHDPTSSSPPLGLFKPGA